MVSILVMRHEYIQDSEDRIIETTKNAMSRFGLIPAEKESRLSLLYHNPKFHKNPPKMRYIAGNVGTVTAKLDRIVALFLKMCKVIIRTSATNVWGFRYCFDVQTSTEVKAIFDSVSGVAESISINDFSTLYTLFDHDHLLSNITWLISKLSKNSGLYHAKIGHDRAWWMRNDSDGDVYAVGELIEMIG